MANRLHVADVPTTTDLRPPCLALFLLVAACQLTRFETVDASLELVTAPPPADAGSVTITVEPDGTGDAKALLQAIDAATRAVHVEMYLLTSKEYVDALTRKRAEGLDVKIVLNREFPYGSSEENEATFEALRAAQVDVVWAPTTTGFDAFTHTKLVLIDPTGPGAAAWIMTMNLDESAPRDNREYLACDTSGADVAEAEAIFEADFASVPIAAEGPLVVAPAPTDNAARVLLALLDGASSSIDVEAEELNDTGVEAELLDTLKSKAASGVAVRIVLEEGASTEQAAAVKALVEAGARVAGHRSGVGLDMHAKAIVVDGARAFVGSENLSGGSLGYNRELGVLFDGPSEVAKVEQAFARDLDEGESYEAR